MMANCSTERSEGRARLLCALISPCKSEHSMAAVIKACPRKLLRLKLQKSLGDFVYIQNTGLHGTKKI